MTKTKTYKEDELPEKFAQRIGLKFNDSMLLCRALTHRSFLNEHPDAIEEVHQHVQKQEREQDEPEGHEKLAGDVAVEDGHGLTHPPFGRRTPVGQSRVPGPWRNRRTDPRP